LLVPAGVVGRGSDDSSDLHDAGDVWPVAQWSSAVSGQRIAGAASPFVGVPVIRRADDRLRIRSDAQDSTARGGVMAKADGVFIYIGTYPSEVAARGDYDIVKDCTAPARSVRTTPR
jgi:hypothetical protein